MTPEQITALIEYLKNIGEMAVSKGFELALRQVYANAAVNILWVVMSLLMIIPVVWLVKQAKTAVSDSSSWQHLHDAEYWGPFGATLLGLFILLVINTNLANAIRSLINPEWYAIDLLFGLVTGG